MREYEKLLDLLVRNSYAFRTIREFAAITSGSWPRAAVLRHDVDSDIRTAQAMFNLERSFGIRSTYYFRLQTVDIPFMRELEGAGSEAGYHYEEIATFAKSAGIRTREAICVRMDEVRQLFQANLRRLRKTTGLPIRTVASHGDFVNRALRMSNGELLDATVRKDTAIEAEAYDEALAERFTLRVSDAPPPLWWIPCDPRPHISNGTEVIHLVLHPSQWRADLFNNAGQLCRRCTEGMSYWAKSRCMNGVGRSKSEAGAPAHSDRIW
jgi:hypothetical protein